VPASSPSSTGENLPKFYFGYSSHFICWGSIMVVEPERPYPVSIEGELDSGLSRWLWLVKWLLAIPHYIILFFLGIALFIMTIVAFFAILFTDRYPRGIFNFNVGVLRWYWRVAYYSYSALGTDRCPPFSRSGETTRLT
jgi:hypothetical protein